MNARVLALIPCYREAARIGEVVRRARPHVDAVVVIDDGSPDTTAEEANYRNKTEPHDVTASSFRLRHASTRGVQSSLPCGSV